MEPDFFDRSVFRLINSRAEALEDALSSDVIFYHGQIDDARFTLFRNFIEAVYKASEKRHKSIAVCLRTPGGSVESAERIVIVLRKHYNTVYFIVPDIAMSAGTVLCMSGDKLYMDYASTLGPIDPQVRIPHTDDYVPAMGYLDKVDEIIEKGDKLTPADIVMLKSINLAQLALYEQARDLSVDLLKNWLVEYKFKKWTKHRTTNPGNRVTKAQKEKRAAEIAAQLADHKKWHSHGRALDIGKLQSLRIEIEDYSDDPKLRDPIREYNDSLTGYIDRMGFPFYLHNHRIHI